MKSLCRVQLFVTPWSAAYQAPPSMGFSRQEYWSGVPLSSPLREHRPVFVLPMAVFHELSCQGRAVPHTVISRILLLPLLVALPFIMALSSSYRFRLDYRRIYIPILGQATHHFGSHFIGKILLIWPHPAPGEAKKWSFQSEHP